MESVDQLKQAFDSLAAKFDQSGSSSPDIPSIKEVLQSIFHSNEKLVSESDLINHRLFVLLRDWYLKVLRYCRLGTQCDEDESSFVLDTIPNLFLKMSNHISEKNVFTMKDLIFHKPLIHELNICLQEIVSNGKYLQDPQMKSLDNIFRAIQRLERHRIDGKTDPSLTNLFDNIVKCICSPSFIEMFIHSATQENEDPGQKFLLHTCTDYIYSHPTDYQHKQSLLDIRQSLLRPFSQWLSQQASSFRLWNLRTTVILRQLCFILTLSIQLNRYANLDKETFEHYCLLIDSFVSILQSIIQTDSPVNTKLAQSLMGTLTPNLYTMTLASQLEKYIRSKQMTSLILKLADIENDEIQLNAFRILATIITEQDAKTSPNAMNIATLFIKFLSKVIDDPNQMLKFYNLLRCLKHLIQYDQIKDELVQQNGIALLLRCATDSKFKPLQAQQPALEILLALTFNDVARRQLKDRVAQLKPLLTSSHQGVSRAVDSLLWRLETEEKALLKGKPADGTCKYDITISYSHSDKELTHRIYDQLVKDDFRVWIDRDETFGTTMITKAEAIDQSHFLLVCISDEYRQNLYCRCEASYASERHWPIIPLMVTLNYHPDGWLSDLIHGKISIDFVISEFDLAYKTLKSEVRQSDGRLKKELIPTLTKVAYPSTRLSLTVDKTPTHRSAVSVTEGEISTRNRDIDPPVIEHWTKDDVRAFLVKDGFECLLPVVSDMNGCLLTDLYAMCRQNGESMFHTLKNEITSMDPRAQPLTLLTYLRFLHELQKHVPKTVLP